MAKGRVNPKIENQAQAILTKFGVTEAPVPIMKLAERVGLKVEAADLGDEISGVLLRDGDHGVIGYNRSHAPVRQRFSVAHECGHYFLHSAKAGLFIDRVPGVVFLRDKDSATGDQWQEIQANQFAAAILMPAGFIRAELSRIDFKQSDEAIVANLAARFEVSVQAMSIRLASLGFLEATE